MRDLLPPHRPALVLAPMQDITDLPFMRVLTRRSSPDWFVTAYFRVHPDSSLNRQLLRAIVENPTQRPVFAQLIGRDLASLCRAARELAAYPIAGIDLNLGCPAPIVCRKHAGGGLLRHPDDLHRLLGGLREAVAGRFTVKSRVGYADCREFETLLEVFSRHALDGLTLHARTVHDGYHGPVHTACVRAAVAALAAVVQQPAARTATTGMVTAITRGAFLLRPGIRFAVERQIVELLTEHGGQVETARTADCGDGGESGADNGGVAALQPVVAAPVVARDRPVRAEIL